MSVRLSYLPINSFYDFIQVQRLSLFFKDPAQDKKKEPYHQSIIINVPGLDKTRLLEKDGTLQTNQFPEVGRTIPLQTLDWLNHLKNEVMIKGVNVIQQYFD